MHHQLLLSLLCRVRDSDAFEEGLRLAAEVVVVVRLLSILALGVPRRALCCDLVGGRRLVRSILALCIHAAKSTAQPTDD